MTSTTTTRSLTVAGLVLGAAGIGILWASGVEFPFYPPPGLLILTAGAAVVAFVRRPWADVVGAALGLCVLVGFVISSIVSGAGTDNLTGAAGTGGVIGTVVQLVGAVLALVAGSVTASRGRRVHAH